MTRAIETVEGSVSARAADGAGDETPSGPGPAGPRVLIVAENASARFGGESILPLHYFRVLRRRGIEAWLVVHDRTRDELAVLWPEDLGRIVFTPDTWLNKLACWTSLRLPGRLNDVTFAFASRLDSLWRTRLAARRLVREHAIDVVHQPTPVSPKEPSVMFGLGAPVVIGPLNGGMTFPRAFARAMDDPFTAVLRRFGRWASSFLNRLAPGKLQAAVVLVANERTRRALPPGIQGAVLTLVENGVDLDLWEPPSASASDGPRAGPARFVFIGRLVDWKAVDLLLEAFARVSARTPATLAILGDGTERSRLEAEASRLGLADSARFLGWRPQAECVEHLRSADALVLPSLFECGGAVVLEAMACGRPVIACDWGGPADYLDPTCGVLIAPDSREGLVSGLAAAMERLAASPELREAMGRAGRAKAERDYDWERKVDRMLEVYGSVVGPAAGRPASSPTALSTPA